MDPNNHHINCKVVQQITQQVAAVIPKIIQQALNANTDYSPKSYNHQGNIHSIPQGCKSNKPSVATSSMKKRKVKHKTTTSANPVATIEIPCTTTQIISTTPPAKRKRYTGTHPQCTTCGYHHPTTCTCRWCFNCGRYGHLLNTCHQPVRPQVMQQALAQIPTIPQKTTDPVRCCYHCGDTNHLRNTCPRLAVAKASANKSDDHEVSTEDFNLKDD